MEDNKDQTLNVSFGDFFPFSITILMKISVFFILMFLRILQKMINFQNPRLNFIILHLVDSLYDPQKNIWANFVQHHHLDFLDTLNFCSTRVWRFNVYFYSSKYV